jgi:CPA2 family monovalent cation:H+ antiporter-2
VEPVLQHVAIYLVAAVIAVPLCRRLGLGSVLGYLAAGFVIGPLLGLVGAEAHDVRHVAEFGIVMMLFLIGLEMDPAELWEMRRRLVGLGGLQVALTLAAVAGIGLAFGLPWRQATAAGMVLCLSSTAIVMQTLQERHLDATEGGRASFAILLFQDLAIVPLLALMSLLAVAPPPEAGVDALSGPAQAGLILGAVALVIVGGRFLTGPIYRFIGLARIREIQVAAALLFVVGIALVMSWLGFSPALGSFLAGVVLSSSQYRHELRADIEPVKGLLMGLFFITVAAGIDLGLLRAEGPALLGLTLALVLVKAAILYAVARGFGLPPAARLLVALGLAQVGEFGFFLLGFAVTLGVLAGDAAERLLLVIALSMFLTPALFLLHDRLSARLSGRLAPGAPSDAGPVGLGGPVVIAGIGRFGQVVNRMLRGLGIDTVILDSHPDTVARMRRSGVPAFYGEVDRPDILEAAGIAEARVLVIAIDDPVKAARVTDHVARHHPGVHVIARARDRQDVHALRAAGASDTIRETFEGSVRAAERALAALGWDEEEIARTARAFLAEDARLLAELDAVWDPQLPAERNPAYLAREREIEARLSRPRGERAAGRLVGREGIEPPTDGV